MIRLDLEVTSKCNLKCDHCIIGVHKDVDMPVEMFKDIVEQFYSLCPSQEKIITLVGGEPTLHPNIREFIDFIHQKGKPVLISTNGFKIPEIVDSFSKQDMVYVSIDGNEKMHDKIRRKGSFKAATDALAALKKAEIPCTVVFTINEKNKKVANQVVKVAKEYDCCSVDVAPYQPVSNSDLKGVSYDEWLKYHEKAHSSLGVQKGSLKPSRTFKRAELFSLLVASDGTYLIQGKNPVGKYPQKLDVFWDHFEMKEAHLNGNMSAF